MLTLSRSAATYKRTYDAVTDLPPGGEILISTDDASDHLKHLKNKAPDLDGIPNHAQKLLHPPTIQTITDIYNAAFHPINFPAPWKTAKIIPIHKLGKSKNLQAVYRPTSFLNTLSKIIEKLILDKILEHINENNILNRDQFRFRDNHSST